MKPPLPPCSNSGGLRRLRCRFCFHARALKRRRPSIRRLVGVAGISLRHLIAFRGNPSGGECASERTSSVLLDRPLFRRMSDGYEEELSDLSLSSRPSEIPLNVKDE